MNMTLPWAGSLSLEEQESLLPLVSSTENAVHQTESFSLNPDNLESLSERETRTFTMAATAQDIPATEGDSPGRWVVIANNGFLDNGILQQHSANLGLTLNALDWLIQNDALISIRTKSSAPSNLVWESKRQQSVVKWTNIIAPPAALILFGVFWIYRRRRKSARQN